MAFNKKHVKGEINVSSLYQAMKAFISTADSNANPDKQQQSPLRESLIKARTNVLRKIVDCYLETNNFECKMTIGKNQVLIKHIIHLLHMQAKRHF